MANVQKLRAVSAPGSPRAMVCVFSVLLVCLFASGISRAQDTQFVSGSLVSTLWYDNIIVIGEIVVLAGQTLTIAKGTRIRFVDGARPSTL